TANDDEVDTYINNPVKIAVLNNDTGLDDGFGELTIHTGPSAGTVTVDEGNTITYTPSYMYFGTMTFEYRVADIDGDWDKATVTVNVLETPNFVPVANNDSCATSFNQPVTIDVLFNDENTFDEPLTLNITELPTEGTAIVNVNNTVTFTPAEDYVGTITFKYTITDKDTDVSNEATVSVKVKSGTNYVPEANDDEATTHVNTFVDIDVLSNDSGLDDGFGALTIHVTPQFGSVSVNDNRTIRFTPGNFFIGEETFVYVLTDKDGDYSTATVTVRVTEKPNSIPVANDISVGTSFNTPVDIDVLHNDTGLDDEPIVVTISQAPHPDSGVATVIPATNFVTFTPTDGFIGQTQFRYTVTDKDGDSDFATVTVNVKEGTNYVPTAVDDEVETIENIAVEIAVLDNDTGFEDGFGSLEVYQVPQFGLAQVNDRTISYTPANNFIGVVTFKYKVSDLDGDWGIANVTVTVTERPNYIPVANNDSCATSFNQATTIDVLFNDEELFDEPLLVNISQNPTEGTAVVNPDNTVTFTPAIDYVGKMTFTYTVTDKDGDTSNPGLVTVNVKSGENFVPIANDDDTTTYINQAVTLNVLTNDSGLDDGFGALEISASPAFGNAVVNDNRTITFTPANNFVGEISFTYILTDLDGDYDIATVTVDVVKKPNSIPVANDITLATSFNTPVEIDVLHNDTGLDDIPITVSITQEPNPIHGAVVVNPANTVTFTPTDGYIGDASFIYTVTDVDGDADFAVVTVTVKEGTNYVPTAVDDNASTYVNTSVEVPVLANDTGFEDGFGRLELFEAPEFGSAIASTYTVLYTPANFFIGQETFRYKVSDSDGDYSIATVTVSVSEKPNLVPIAHNDSCATSFNEAVVVNVLINDENLGDEPITVAINGNPTQGTATVNADNTVTYTPATDFVGKMEFTYTVTDKDGDSDEATVSVNVKAGTNYVPVANDDEETTYVNTPVTINVLQNDTGLEDGFNEISIQVQPQFGTAVVNSNNTITYTPSNNMLGEETFTYKLVDNDGDFDLAEVTVTIIEKPNSRPVANDVSVATSFNTPVTIDVLHNDTGLEDTPITVSITQPVDTKKGTAVVNADNTVTFTPTTDYVGFATFTYTATDRDGDSDNAIVTVNVKSGINYWPVAEDDEATTYVNTPVDIAVLANDSGLEDGIGAITIQVAPQFGSVTISNNIVTYTPANFFEGEETFVYKLADIDGDFDFATVTVTTIERPNSIPIANNVSVATSFNTPVTIDVLHNDTGLDDTPITVTISLQADAEEGTATVNPDNTVTFTPTENYIGFATFEYTVTDADGEFDDAIVTVNVKEGINYVPVANDDEASTIVNRSVDIPVLRNDTGLEDGIDSLSIQVRPKFGTATVNQNLTVTYTPSNNYTGVETFIYKLTDNDGDFDFALVTVTITEQENSIPVANDDSRGTSFNTPVIIDVLHNDTGLDDVPITVSIKSLPIYTQGTVEVNDDNTITFTPATDYTGTASFSYTVTDANEDSDDANVTVIVKSGTNYIPDASDDEAETIQNTSVEIAVLANDRGLEDGFGSITIFQQPPFGKVMVTPNRTLNYIPDNNYIGEESFVYQLSDVDGDYDLATVTVTVIERPNYIPVANDDRRGTSFNTPVTIDVLFNDEGIEDKPLTLTVSLAPDAAQGTAAVNSNNTITFTPIQGFVGEATFRYTVTDKDGENDDALVTVNVKEGVNYVPNAVNDQATTTINTSVDVAILANDSGFEDGFGEITIHNEPPFGTVEINENRTVTYTPSPNFVGVETFTYTVSDIDGDFDIATVTVTVTEKPNSVPVANDDRRGTSFNTAVDIDVLFNDLGLDDEPITVEVSTAPIADQGTAVVNENNTVTFTPKTGFIGFANFVYTITDADGERDDATVTVSVKEGENYVPNAVDDNATTIVNTPVDIAVVANDTGFEDGFGDLAIHIAPQFGTATIKDRSVTYTPSPNFIGEETFVYVVSDADGDYDIATVTVTVTDKPNYVPIANDDKRGTSFNTSVTVDVLFNDLNLEDEPITVTISENPTTETGAVIVNSKNMVVFTPTTGFVGTSTFRYTVTDNNGDSDDAQVTINVKSGENFVPEANDDEAYTYLNTPVRIVVLQNDGGLEDGVENIAIYSNPATGTVEVNSDFSVTYIPSNNYVGTEEFTYIVSDVDGDFDMATVTVSVTEDTNIIPVANDDNRGTSFNTAVTVDVLANDTGLSDLPIAVTISENPASEMGTTTVNADNTVTFTPATGYIGPAVFRYTVTDANFDNDNALVTINVKEGENAVPIANDDQRGTSLNTEIVVDVLANDEGLDDEPITLTITSEPDVEHGVAFVNSNNTITFTPIVGFIGIARFTYKVTDVDGDFDSALVMINVKSGNNIVPVAVNDEVTTTINNDVIISVLDNDTGLDDKPILVTISMEPKPEEGAALENTDNTITFSPAENYTGTLTFMYRVTDGDGDYSIATVTVNVVESGSPVTANDDNVEITKNSSVDIDILANDTGINGVELTVSIVTEPLFGVATVNYDYTLNYVPNAYYYGLDSLTYQLCDLDNNCDEAKVRITVIDSDPNKLQIPEGFSPNGDTKNDYFEIIGLEYFGQVSVKIYNRWGNLVYKSNFYRNDWDGTSNTSMSIGKTLPTGTYYYIIEIVETGEKFNGNVFLKR
nr:Ig-like domain-containing protein [Tenuifilaceae bacterium]